LNAASPRDNNRAATVLPCRIAIRATGAVELALAVLRQGGVVAYPTEHFYALACDPWNAAAVSRLFVVKGRPDNKPLLLGIADRAALTSLSSAVPDAARRLVEEWPQGVTLVVPAVSALPAGVTAGTGTVGVRLLPESFAAELIRTAGGALPATSANQSGAGATGDPDVVARLPGVDLLLDGGILPAGSWSTIVDVRATPWRVLREGQCPIAVVAGYGALAQG